MKVFENGTYRKMTELELQQMANAVSELCSPIPSAEERLNALESALLSILGVMRDV